MTQNSKHSKENGAAFEAVWVDIKNIYSVRLDKRPWYGDKRLTEADLQRWARETGISNKAVCDQVAIRLAEGFHDRELDFTFCDTVINHLFQTNTGSTYFQSLFWQIYLAFDAGEAYAPDGKGGHKRDEDPSEVYTRPEIAKIIDSLKSEGSKGSE